MSERKTTEIKLRVTPDEKARWQIEAERQGIALSELIRQTLNGLVQNQALLAHKEAHPLPAIDDYWEEDALHPYGPLKTEKQVPKPWMYEGRSGV